MKKAAVEGYNSSAGPHQSVINDTVIFCQISL